QRHQAARIRVRQSHGGALRAPRRERRRGARRTRRPRCAPAARLARGLDRRRDLGDRAQPDRRADPRPAARPAAPLVGDRRSARSRAFVYLRPDRSRAREEFMESPFPHLAGLPPTLDDSTAGTPARAPGSVRRTSTIDMVWPGGFGTPLHLVGRSRDLLTPRAGAPRVLDEASMAVGMGEYRTITSIEVTPQRDGIAGLLGAVAGSEMRGAIDRALPGEREAATPLHLLLDDVAGRSPIRNFAWTRRPELFEAMKRAAVARGETVGPRGMRKGRIICSGLRPDGWADTHWRHEMSPRHGVVPAGDIRAPGDPLAWHALPPAPDVGVRRHRRVGGRRAGGAGLGR